MQAAPLNPLVLIRITNFDLAFTSVCHLPILERNIRLLKKKNFTVMMLNWTGCPVEFHQRLTHLAELYSIPVIFETELAKLNQPYLQIVGEHQYGLSGSHFERAPLPDPLPRGARGKSVKQLEQDLFDEIFANTEGWIARGLNKKISFPISRVLVKTEITPNQITIAIFLMGLVGCFLLLSQSWLARIVGASLLNLNSILDGCDGEVAKLKILSSRLGAWLDTIADDVLNNVMLVCLYVGLVSQTHQSFVLKIGIFSSLASLGVSVFIYHYLITHNTQNAAHFKLSWEKDRKVDHSSKSLFDRFKPLLKRDFFIFIVWIFVILDLRLALLVVAVVPIWVAFLLYLASFVYSIVGRPVSDV